MPGLPFGDLVCRRLLLVAELRHRPEDAYPHVHGPDAGLPTPGGSGGGLASGGLGPGGSGGGLASGSLGPGGSGGGLASGQLPEPLQSLVRVLIVKWLLRIQPMSMLRGTDARAAFSGDLDEVSPRRVGHYLRSFSLLEPAAWWRLAQEVNLGVIPGRGEACQEDVFTFLAHATGDVVYLDPPYPGTTPYEREYAVIDDLLEGRRHQVSGFSRSADLLPELFRACEHIPVWLVSMNNAALSLEELEVMVRSHRGNLTSIRVPYRHLGSIASEEKNAKNEEYIIVATT